MKKQFSKFAQVAGIMLALVFTFSCSNNDDNNGGSSSPSSSPSGGGDDSSSSGDNGGSGGSSSSGYSYGVMTDTRDRQTYKTVVIDNKTWMAENMNYLIDGSTCYNEEPNNCDTYGMLYDWDDAVNKACPSSWHLATKDDWEDLVYLAGGLSSDAAAAKLKAESGWNSSRSNGTNDYGFSAIPGGEGYLTSYGYSFRDLGNIGKWWSSEDRNNTSAGRWDITAAGKINYIGSNKSNLHSVRCVKN